jgi:hypothetical protein
MVAQVPSPELIDKGRALDGKEIEFTGELIGDPMVRGDHVWVNVSDGANAIGVWLPRTLLPSVRFWGSYRARGDTIRVRGVFHRSCPDHGGDMDIHGSAVEIVSIGRPTEHRIGYVPVLSAVLLLFCSPAVFLLWRKREKVLEARF